MNSSRPSDTEGQSTEPVDLTFRVGTAPKIIVWDGAEACYFDDAYQGGESHLRPLQKAVLITRLRVLADILESTP